MRYLSVLLLVLIGTESLAGDCVKLLEKNLEELSVQQLQFEERIEALEKALAPRTGLSNNPAKVRYRKVTSGAELASALSSEILNYSYVSNSFLNDAFAVMTVSDVIDFFQSEGFRSAYFFATSRIGDGGSVSIQYQIPRLLRDIPILEDDNRIIRQAVARTTSWMGDKVSGPHIWEQRFKNDSSFHNLISAMRTRSEIERELACLKESRHNVQMKTVAGLTKLNQLQDHLNYCNMTSALLGIKSKTK